MLNGEWRNFMLKEITLIFFCPNRLAELVPRHDSAAFISITDHARDKALQHYRISKHELQLYFYDVDLLRGDDALRQEWGTRAMQPEHAVALWRFLAEVSENVSLLYVSCDAGVSRSKAVAFALRDSLHMPEDALCEALSKNNVTAEFRNEHVYQTVIEGYKTFLQTRTQ